MNRVQKKLQTKKNKYYFYNIILTLTFYSFLNSCGKGTIGVDPDNVKLNPGIGKADGNGGNGGETPTPTPNPTNPNGNGTATKAGEAPKCQGIANEICEGGYDSAQSPTDLHVKIVYASPAGSKLTNNAVDHARTFLENMNKNFEFRGHRYINLKFDPAKVVEVDEKSDQELIADHAEAGYLVFILVANIPGGTVGYVTNICAEIEKKQMWSIFEFSYVANGVVEHESMHLACFPHTSCQNGGTPNFFIPGYNSMTSLLNPFGAVKKPFNPNFKIYTDQQNRSNANVMNDDMNYFTGNLMYYSILPAKPKLFTDNGEGYPYSYALLLDYFYWGFIHGKSP